MILTMNQIRLQLSLHQKRLKAGDPAKNDAFGPEQVIYTIASAPPEQDLLTRSVELSGAQSPAPCGAFCYGLMTDPMATHPRKPSQTPFRLRTS